ncbi:MAG: hypothetical protein K2O28_03750 [Clostridia bacterium]|nr:hypothetical protein [Clostridia bacterium]
MLRIFEKGCVKLGDDFKVKRGNIECKAFYFNYEKRKARFYFERYTFKRDKHGVSCVNVVLFVFDENDAFAAEKALNRPKVKAFFDSIEYF